MTSHPVSDGTVSKSGGWRSKFLRFIYNTWIKGLSFRAPEDRKNVTAGMPHMPALDGARGLAVLLVLMDHTSDSGMKVFGIDINRTGKYGVYLFFVLSAFLLTYQFFIKSTDDLAKAKTWLNYGFRRFMRIFPLYALVLVILHPGAVMTHLLLRDGRGPFWTIPVEVKYYMLLPFIVLALFWAGRKH